MIDSHCHLLFDYEGKSADTLIEEARQVGVRGFIHICTEPKELEAMGKFSETHAEVFHSIGIHPHEGSLVDAAVLEEVRKKSLHPKCVAIGEIGLDYYYNHSARDAQIQALQAQLEIALESQRPIIIHSRDAEAELLPILEKYARDPRLVGAPGVIHCFSGTPEFGLACVKLGFYLSFSGILTFKKAEALKETARQIPLDRVLVETDAPFLAPVPYRGKKCEPRFVVETAKCLAELRGLELSEIDRITEENTLRLFSRMTLPKRAS